MIWWTLRYALAQPVALATLEDIDALEQAVRSHEETAEALLRATGLALHAARGEDPCAGTARARALAFHAAWQGTHAAWEAAAATLARAHGSPTLPFDPDLDDVSGGSATTASPDAPRRARHRQALARSAALLRSLPPGGACDRAVAPAAGFPDPTVPAADDPDLRAVWVTAPGHLCGPEGALAIEAGVALVVSTACWAPTAACSCTQAWPLDGAALGPVSP